LLELKIVGSISSEKVWNILKENSKTKRKIDSWVILPYADGEFVANMAELQETYEQSFDDTCPIVCMDEKPEKLVGDLLSRMQSKPLTVIVLSPEGAS